MKTIHGYLLEIDPSVDKGVELSLFETGTYEKGVLEVIRRYFDHKTTFVDVGANIGAQLQTDQAQADLKVAEAKAEEALR